MESPQSFQMLMGADSARFATTITIGSLMLDAMNRISCIRASPWLAVAVNVLAPVAAVEGTLEGSTEVGFLQRHQPHPGAGLAAAAGIMVGLYYGSVRYDMGFVPGIKAFAAAVLGGIGNITGAMLGGLVIGMVEIFGAGYISGQYKDVFAFIILIAVLYFRPTGIMGENVDDTRV